MGAGEADGGADDDENHDDEVVAECAAMLEQHGQTKSLKMKGQPRNELVEASIAELLRHRK